jgi:cellulose synthase/poly-beta-1,6-N-acetylglucosamine synthase-like glycosyltransferase
MSAQWATRDDSAVGERGGEVIRVYYIYSWRWRCAGRPAYIAWRIGWSWQGANGLLWVTLLLAELYGVVSLVLLAWLTWELKAAERPSSSPGTSVDVYVCTYDEAPAVLEATLAGCALMSYPHTTWLLDDGTRPEMAALAQAWGARYIARSDKSHAKAGNINHALPLTEGELVLVLDADHVPLPDALDTLVGYFDDSRVALVQTPHDFSNHDSVQHYDLGRHEQSVFFSAICVGKNRHNSAFWCGSGALIRRQALLSSGGVATDTIAEDFHTTIKLHRLGWRTHYDDRVVVQGRAPHDLAAYLLQRDRWARGNLAVFRTPESPLRARELSASQRLSYFASLSAYFAGPVRILMLLTLAAVLWTGALPLHIAPLALAALWAPATLLMVLAGSALCRGQQSSAETVHYELCTAEIFTRALRCVIKPGRTTFRVTPKEGIDHGGWQAVRQFRLLLVCAVLLGAGVAWRLAEDAGAGFGPALHGFAAWFVPLLGAFELRRVARTLWLVAHHRQLRAEYRTPLAAAASLVPNESNAVGDLDLRGKREICARRLADTAAEDGAFSIEQVGKQPSLLARMHDITTSGVGFELDRPLPLGTVATLTVQLPSTGEEPTPVQLEVAVRACLVDVTGHGVSVQQFSTARKTPVGECSSTATSSGPISAYAASRRRYQRERASPTAASRRLTW